MSGSGTVSPVLGLLLSESQPAHPAQRRRLVVDPITRIEGHLRIEVEITGGAVSRAWSTGTLFRGVETILQGRRPEDAWLFTQRLCGVCTYVHGSTSVRSVEDALGLTIPPNARLVRNLLMGAQYLHDHIVHFYHLHALDWVDVVSALSADPAAAAALAADLSPSAPALDFAAVKTRLSGFAGSGQLGPFNGGYWGHPQYKLSPEANLVLVAHYLEALAQQVRTAQLHAIFGGKNPHPQSLVVGGVTCRNELNSASLNEFRAILRETTDFIEQFYIPDLLYVASQYPEWSRIGGFTNYLAAGEFPQSAVEPQSLFFPQGVITNRSSLSDLNQASVSEHVRHSWYSGNSDRHPYQGETSPAYTGLDTDDRYSWLKAPRYQGAPMEVGPLARVLVAYMRGVPEVVAEVNAVLSATGLPASGLHSTLGRTAARGIETKIIARAMSDWLDELTSRVNGGDRTVKVNYTMPSTAQGMGWNEAPRGALGHWINISGGNIGNYQMVVPSTWNLGPRCSRDLPGPVEAALVGTPVADPERPLEIIRTVHSFDPCLACAVHVIDAGKGSGVTVRVV